MPLYTMNAEGRFEPFQTTPFQDLEQLLEDRAETNPHLLFPGENLAIIARQPRTPFGKFADLIAVDVSGACIVIELKRGETPREVVAQALEYAAWLDSLTLDDLDVHARDYAAGKELPAAGVADLYRLTFPDVSQESDRDGTSVTDSVTFNQQQRILIVAGSFSPELEQTLRYLRTKLGIDVTAIKFSVHRSGEEIILETQAVVGREVIATAAAKTVAHSGRPVGQPQSDDQLVAMAETSFVKAAVPELKSWIGGIPGGRTTVKGTTYPTFNLAVGHNRVLYYYFAKGWVYVSLYIPTSAELHLLRSRLREPGHIKEFKDNVSFRLVAQPDTEILKEIVAGRLNAFNPKT